MFRKLVGLLTIGVFTIFILFCVMVEVQPTFKMQNTTGLCRFSLPVVHEGMRLFDTNNWYAFYEGDDKVYAYPIQNLKEGC